VVCGDLHDGGSEREAIPVIEALGDMGPSILIVPGNMDPRGFAGRLWENAGFLVLHKRSLEVMGTGFAGLGCVAALDPRRWGDERRCYHSDEEVYRSIKEGFEKISTFGRRVIVTHQPPRGILDRAFDGKATGSMGLRKFIEEFQPDLLFCAHIHEARGEARLGRTMAINPGEMRKGLFALVDLDLREEYAKTTASSRISWFGPGSRGGWQKE
jgi:uncharacterized protein